ncbi:hypothetical protein CUZ56_02990 [Saezia sanguinis]|uniref:Uncharacterized protein n=1 Tax=Saezia sanguinis TaxID=1965230 RepID=A0A433S9N4_9BURK|nr:hypothetical protein CUZ56_02990 [Saezia sanguinis]
MAAVILLPYMPLAQHQAMQDLSMHAIPGFYQR